MRPVTSKLSNQPVQLHDQVSLEILGIAPIGISIFRQQIAHFDQTAHRTG